MLLVRGDDRDGIPLAARSLETSDAVKSTVFENRADAGRRLAEKLVGYVGEPDVLVLGLPRGGVPVAAAQTCDVLAREADDVVCALTPEPFYAVGLWYADFSQTTDDEVHELLQRASEQARA